MRYGLLKQRNPEYDPDLMQRYQELYEGGDRLLRNAKAYMPKVLGEGAEAYKQRIDSASYLGYMGQICDYYVANLFSQELTVTPAADAQNPQTPGTMPDADFYTAFAADSDNTGTPFAKLLRKVFTTALVKRRGYLAVDFPKQTYNYRPRSLSDEDKLGSARAYCFEVPPEQMIDWQYDDRGGYKWVVINRSECNRNSPEESRGQITEEFKIWRKDDKSGAITWEIYRCTYDPGKPPNETDNISIVDQGTATGLTRIPIIQLVMPYGLWLGNKIACLAKEHFQRRNALIAATNKNLFAIGVVKLGPAIPSDGSVNEIQQDPGRGESLPQALANKGYMVVGSDDDVGFAEPTGACYKLVADNLSDLKDEMFRVSHQMAASVSNTTVSLGRSGDSKAEDRQATAIVLGAYGEFVRTFAKNIYNVVSSSRNETVIWTPHGLDNYDGIDRAQVVQEAVQMSQVDIPSQTFTTTWKTRVALQLVPNVPVETQEQIRQEIKDGVTAALQQSAQPQPPTNPTQQQGLPGQTPSPNIPGKTPFTAPGQQLNGQVKDKDGNPLPAQVASPGKAGTAPGGTAAAASSGQDVAAARALKPGQKAPDPGAYAAAHPTVTQRGVGTSGIARTVYNQLADDFDESLLTWVTAADWSGPLRVDLKQIDFTNRDNWRASREMDQVRDFAARIRDQKIEKPIILVNEPNNAPLITIDGHHRLLAYELLGMQPLAYVGIVNDVGGAWRAMHASQRRGKGASSIFGASMRNGSVQSGSLDNTMGNQMAVVERKSQKGT